MPDTSGWVQVADLAAADEIRILDADEISSDERHEVPAVQVDE